jgi:RNA methyltransferase, TrmH family
MGVGRVITSTSNERIKQVRRMQERKGRLESGCFYLEGLRIVGEAFEVGAQLEELVVAEELLRSDYGRSLVERFRSQGGDVLFVSRDVFERLAQKEGPQGIAAIVRQRWTLLGDVKVISGRPWVALDSVADPGNLGTILRTNDAIGGQGVILLDQSTDPYDPAAVRASMGALFDQQVARCSLEEFAAWKQSTGVAVIGTSGAAEIDYHEFTYPDRLVLLMGSERQGLQGRHLEICDRLVRIPMIGKSDSLNLAVATAVTLFEVFNQRRDAGGKR